MRIKVEQTIRRISLGMVTCIMVLGGAALASTYGEPEVVMQEQEIFKYQLTPQVGYEVQLVENNLYETSQLPEGEYYLSHLIQGIQADFLVNFEGSSAVELKGEYGIVAELSGYIVSGESHEAIWSKTYELVPKTPITGTGETWQVEHEVPINYNGYRQFAEAVKETIKVTLPTEVVVRLEGEVETEVSGKVIKIPLQTALSISLEGNYFQISKSGVEPISEQVKEQVEVVVPVDGRVRLGYGMMMGVGIGVCLFLIFGTQSKPPKNKERKESEKILKAYGSRMAAIRNMDESLYPVNYSVYQIEDLVKISDEIEQPILYVYHSEREPITRFYVRDKETLYTYTVVAIPVEQERMLAKDEPLVASVSEDSQNERFS